jgi:DNA-binding SARP family transcriptional activator
VESSESAEQWVYIVWREEIRCTHRRITLLIHADPVNEALHRGLLRSYRTQGLDSDALTANRRYRALMQRLLGGEPPAAALALVSALP